MVITTILTLRRSEIAHALPGVRPSLGLRTLPRWGAWPHHIHGPVSISKAYSLSRSVSVSLSPRSHI